MDATHISKISQELGFAAEQVQATVDLLNEGATVPFIARYRKEATGTLDEVAISTIRDRLHQLMELDKRREAILQSLDERGQLTDELRGTILAAETMAVLEDIYLPHRPKRRTRAKIAKERGLEPLAQRLFMQEEMDPLAEASAFADPEKGVNSVEDALAGARDIIAEWVNEDQTARAMMRALFSSKAVFKSRVIPEKETEGMKYKDYFDWQEPVKTAPSHRILAMRRGENEGFLILRVFPPEEEALDILDGLFVKGEGPASQQVKMSVHDSYKRLLFPSMEAEIRLETKKRADEEAIRVFVENARQLLLAPPLGQKNVLAIDPGFRTGCKVVCLDRQGKLLHTETIFPLQSEKSSADAGSTILSLCERFFIEAIAVGNGTAGRETEAFIRSLNLSKNIQVVMVNESGASVYSASEVAREEFPDQDVTVRGSVSIGRRLMDPLAELVKIDPKSIGVGQYQHDVDQGALKSGLDDVVSSCVNRVGVEVNTASKQLLTYVSGLGPQLAKGIVEYRNAHGPFRSREDLKQVPRLGPKAFEQAAGFLRIRDGENPLDRSAVHPESYSIVDAMARNLGCSVLDLMHDERLRKRIDLGRYVSEKVGLPTLNDILSELSKPGRDPREQFEAFRFAEGIEKIEDVKPEMKLPGIVTNITAFGVFVDIGVHQDGLIHISEVSSRFVKNLAEVVKVHQKVMVTVLAVDLSRNRISLSMKDRQPGPEGILKAEEERKEDKRHERKQKQKSTFTNNPFASALRNRS
ncbi:MAG TPA: Tex family protein [Thermodesulfobacteriota bacterium]|nr:Tex family protein [Thermodesulfobacteriota bacterium]